MKHVYTYCIWLYFNHIKWTLQEVTPAWVKKGFDFSTPFDFHATFMPAYFSRSAPGWHMVAGPFPIGLCDRGLIS